MRRAIVFQMMLENPSIFSCNFYRLIAFIDLLDCVYIEDLIIIIQCYRFAVNRLSNTFSMYYQNQINLTFHQPCQRLNQELQGNKIYLFETQIKYFIKIIKMKETARSFGQRLSSSISTPITTRSRRKSKAIKEQKTVHEIYDDMKNKMYEMQSSFKNEHLYREREMLKTYIKVLNKIGSDVMQSKQRYLNLDKQALKTDKRLQIVEELNREREKCRVLVNSIKHTRQEIKNFEDENVYLEKQVQAFENIEKRKKVLQLEQKQKYKQNKRFIRSLQKNTQSKSIEVGQLPQSFKRLGKRFNQISDLNNTFDIRTRIKSFMLEEQFSQGNPIQSNPQVRPHTQQKQAHNLGNKRKQNKYFNVPLHENLQLENKY